MKINFPSTFTESEREDMVARVMARIEDGETYAFSRCGDKMVVAMCDDEAQQINIYVTRVVETDHIPY